MEVEVKVHFAKCCLKCGCVGWGDSSSCSGIDLGMSPMLSLAKASCFLLGGGRKGKCMWGLSLLCSVMGWRSENQYRKYHLSYGAHWIHSAFCSSYCLFSLVASSHSPDGNCWSFSKITCDNFLFPWNLCWHLLSKYCCMCPFPWNIGKRSLDHSCSLLLLACFCVCDSSG